ncbi:hypothetical protein KFE94_16765 [bacterium SCSIO 12643]|nr:hypothetical protein KFE94_16765 [bacterium SCSIO 12643]
MFILIGCQSNQFLKSTDVDGVLLPVYEDYILNKSNEQNYFSESKLFVCDKVYKYEEGCSFFIYHFWENGRLFYSTCKYDYQLANKNIINDKSGMAGYYYLVGDTVYTEIFTSYDGGKYLYKNYVIKGDSLVEIEKFIRKPGSRNKRKITWEKDWDVFIDKRIDSTGYWMSFW